MELSREMASPLVDLLPTTTQSSSESAPLHHQGPLQRQGPARRQRRVQRRRARKVPYTPTVTGSVKTFFSDLPGRNGNRICNQRTHHNHPDHGDDKDSICDFFKAMHSAQASRAQRLVRKQTRDQKQQCVDSQHHLPACRPFQA
jgi:hypothetical protein